VKNRRQKKILEAIAQKPIGTQGQLVEELRNAGFDATQATVSRDIRELGLVKTVGANGTSHYTFPEQTISLQNNDRLKRLFENSVISLDYSENLIVVKTHPGEAQGVASALDLANWEEIIGTVAGDDTILIIVKPKKATPAVIKRLTDLAGR
jgi:transcriptional regulator of arginine metabolism